MIYKQCVLTIAQNTATLDEDIYLFRLDKNIQLYFTIVNNKYKFDKSDLNNIINITNASFFQVRLYKDDQIKYTFAIQPTEKGQAILTITDQLIDEPVEVGDYDFQISLLDADKTSMISMPIVNQQLHVCEPLVDNQAIMGKAVLGLSSLASEEIKNAFDSEGNYIREIHKDGDILSAQLVNKFEEALDTNTKSIKSQNNNLPHTISSKKLATVPASDIKLDDEITINNVSINKDRRYYIEFLGIKKLCTLVSSEEEGNIIMCNINNYKIETFDDSNNMIIFITKINEAINDVTFTDLIIYEEEVKYLDNKYLETDLVLQNSISLGRAGNIGPASSAIGGGVEASGICSHAEGNGTISSGNYSHSEGYETKASGKSSHAEGDSTTASGNYSHAEGTGTEASGNTSHAEGSSTIAFGNYSHAEGSNTKADGDHSHAEGYDTTASGQSSHSEGKFTTASGQMSHAEGRNAIASSFASHAEGYGTTASSQNQHVQGKFNIEDTENKYAHIVGNGSDNTSKSNAHTLDWNGNAWYAGQVEGTNLPYDISSKKIVTVPASNIILDGDIVINNVSIIKDRKYYIEFLGSKKVCNVMLGSDSTFECYIGEYVIIGILFPPKLIINIYKMSSDNTTVDTFTDLIVYEEEIKCLDNKYLENDLTVQNSISLGRIGDIGTLSSAVGLEVTATGEGSHSEGYGTTASGNFSHAEGSFTEALAEDTHAEGSNTVAASQYQHVQGQYNIKDAEGKYAHIVGNGKHGNRANAHTLDWNGNAWFAGKLSQEGTPTEDKDLVTKKYVADKISSLPQFSFNESGELVVTINGASKTFVPKDS